MNTLFTLGTKKEMYKVSKLDDELKNNIETMLIILDLNFGTDRNYFIESGFADEIFSK